MTEIPTTTHSSFEAHGAALAWWQAVETGLYYIVHACLGTKESLSSTVFFSIKSPTAKCSLADALVRQCLSAENYDEEWTPLRKELTTAAESRNHLAHFEMQGVVYLSKDPVSFTVRAELTEPFHDIKTHQRETVKSYDQKALEAVAAEFRNLTGKIMVFVEKHFGAQGLPQELVRQGRKRVRYLDRKKQTPPEC